MNIGIDIDNVISNFNEELLKEYLKHDKKLRNTGIINKSASYIRKGMFDWTTKEEKDFYNKNIERIAINLKCILDVSLYVKKIKELGNKIFIITGRDNGEYTDPDNMTKKWLSKNNIIYDELIITNAYNHIEKADVCLEKDIDIMIDDSIRVCEKCSSSGINSILFDTEYNRDEKRFDRVNNWLEVYEYIKNYKINVILDTDTYNECDDQFALSYLIKFQDKVNIEAITVAPYSHFSNRNVTVSDGQELSYKEIVKIANMIRFDICDKVFKGATNYIKNGYSEENEAVDTIIKVALKNNQTYILSIGAITNIALAIKKEPKIIDKIKVIWLGGHELNYKDNLEYNFKQDIEAVRIVFESKVNLTVIPCKDVTSVLRIEINDLKANIDKKSKLNNYLIQRFYNDGYHGIQESRVVWDIVVIAYIINKNWFEETKVSCPVINGNTSYELNTNNHKINFVTKINREKIYEDLFKKLGE